MKTFVAIVALSAVLLIGVHTAFADELDLTSHVDERNTVTPAAPLFMPGAQDDESKVISEPAELRDAV